MKKLLNRYSFFSLSRVIFWLISLHVVVCISCSIQVKTNLSFQTLSLKLNSLTSQSQAWQHLQCVMHWNPSISISLSLCHEQLWKRTIYPHHSYLIDPCCTITWQVSCSMRCDAKVMIKRVNFCRQLISLGCSVLSWTLGCGAGRVKQGAVSLLTSVVGGCL